MKELNTTNTTTNTTTTAAPLFPYIEKAVKKEADERKKEIIFLIENGYSFLWDENAKSEAIERIEKNPEKKDNYLKEYITASAWNDYQIGKITREKAVKKATARALKEIDKQTEKSMKKIKDIENAPDLVSVSVSVTWKRSQMWGYNPYAEISTKSKTESGYNYNRQNDRAGGCGYDKLSAAIASSFDKCPEILKLLYIAENNRLRGTKTRKQSRRDIIGYGSGYGVLPYFEGGCGVSVFYKIFESCGYTFAQTASGKTFDVFTVEKKEKKERAKK